MSFPNATLKPESFQIHIPQSEVDRMKQLIALAPLPRQSFETLKEDRQLGMTGAFMKKAVPYWRDEYDWKKSEAKINQFPHFRVPVPDEQGHVYTMHFIAVMSEQKDAIPLILLHGWPGSFLEFLDMIPLLAASKSPAFHLIIPSLPGFGFSSPPPLDRDIEPLPTVCYLMHKLMTGLGFSSYAAQGGDLGSFISRGLAAEYPESCKAYHVNMAIAGPPAGYDFANAPKKEQAWLARGEEWRTSGQSYGDTHGYRTSTISHVLASSPVALFAWIGEKHLEWTEKDPSLELMCEHISLYWLTETIGTTLYFYRSFKRKDYGRPKSTGDVPFGYSLFPYEIYPVPKSWAASFGNLQYYKEHDKGGHFPAMEWPQVLAQDLIECFGEIYKP